MAQPRLLTHAELRLAFNMPESDVLPSPISMADLFPPNRDAAIVNLAAPAREPRGVNLARSDSARDRAAQFSGIEPAAFGYNLEWVLRVSFGRSASTHANAPRARFFVNLGSAKKQVAR